MSDSLSFAVDQLIREVVLPLEESGVIFIDPNMVASAVLARVDVDHVSPALMAYCATMDLRQRCRKFLARRHDPVEKAAAFAAFQSDDLFSGMLQDYYPTRRQNDAGEPVPGYARRGEMSRAELRKVSKRLRKAGSAMIEHADALDAYAAERAA